jgi:hypothetical protein
MLSTSSLRLFSTTAAGIFLSFGLFFLNSNSVFAVEAPPIRDASYRAQFVRQSVPDPVRLSASATTSVTVTYRNVGTATWQPRGSRSVTVFTFNPKYHPSDFADRTWVNNFTPGRLTSVTKPGEEGSFTFVVRAPSKEGAYREGFYLAADNYSWVGKGYFYLDFVVTAPKKAPVSLSQPAPTTTPDQELVSVNTEVTSTPVVAVVSLGLEETTATPAVASSVLVSSTPAALIVEPTVRVLLLKATTTVPVALKFPYQIYSGTVFQSFLNASSTVFLSYENGSYVARDEQGMVLVTSADPLRLVPVQSNDYFVLPANERRIKGRPYPFNAYRGILEFRFSPASSSTLVINELPLDWYIAGITETWDGAPTEYIKALLVAARSYAYTQLRTTAGANKLFDVYASTNDQLYLGYDAELSMPHVAAAQLATYGEMVTYQGTPVITPYSSRTNGVTRTWKQAWGGSDKAWLQPVVAKYDQGYARLGHGVGMSNHDGELRAKKDGWGYKAILEYYYTGTKVEKLY